jgi:hypothetical protein
MAHESQVNDPEMLRQQLLQGIVNTANHAVELGGKLLGNVHTATFNRENIRDEGGHTLAYRGPSIGIWGFADGGSQLHDGSTSLGDIGVFQHDEEVATGYSEHIFSEWFAFVRRSGGSLDVERHFDDHKARGMDGRGADELAETMGLDKPSNDELAELNDLLADRVQNLAAEKAQEVFRQQRLERRRGIGRVAMRLLRFRNKR